MTPEILTGDCLDRMSQLDDGCIDAVFTSPPYNLRNSAGNTYSYPESAHKNTPLLRGYDGHSDDMPVDEYVQWQRECLAEMMRLIRPGGVIFYNHKWRCQGGLLQDQSAIVKDFPVRQILIWDRGSSQNQNRSYFLPVYEVIYVIARPGFMLKKGRSGTPAVLRISPAGGWNTHPAPFPVELPRTVLSATDSEVVLDPFIGSGTTAIACMELGMHCIGIEKSEAYAKMAVERIKSHSPQRSLI